jgi:hypothetical protein
VSPLPDVTGHLAVAIPSERHSLAIAQSGWTSLLDAPLEAGPAILPVVFYTHDGSGHP